MKYIVLVGDGMADYPVKELGERTPLEVAPTPNMDFIAQHGRLGQIRTVPAKMQPASDVANISILGYDPPAYYTGRGPLEAANLGVHLEEGDVAFRCNLITTSGDTLLDYSAGHISSKESSTLMKFLDAELGTKEIKFYPGVSYRNLILFKSSVAQGLDKVICRPPHDITGQKIFKNLPKGAAAKLLLELMSRSREILPDHEVNHVRIDLKENPANMIWLWGQGKKPAMPTFKEKFGLEGSVISAVDLIKGLGKIIGLDVINVKGATGYYDTNYQGKAEAALKSLKTKDFVFVHVEAPDEAGHNGDLREKMLAIERFDKYIVGAFLEAFKDKDNFRILVLPDHATPVARKTHVADMVCFGIYGKGITSGNFTAYNENEARKSELVFQKGHELMNYFIKSGL
ncbi:MAG: cofactor-independent phosphoglycerate mutase [Candidatus Omnitrophica bacterium]|nr:cofactor-independent phosphoglycerate mutase [Candidatus Omnitrophota bacterium]MDD5237160.1 cofactor-independent phosphoglycerate mutase [Candidatus Omnitrophota bacterium]MDD5610428.1 cofactor-independent phosphoglycerate mutase [Candidatus Omnitrophota bacterium]